MMKKMKLALALSGSLVAGVAGVAMAHPGGGDRGAVIQKYDTNNDGKLDDQERAAMRSDFKAQREAKKAEMLAKYDTNKDGKLDDNERKVMRDDFAVKRFNELDTDKNGSISLDELKKGMEQGPKHGHWGRRGPGRGHHGMSKA